MNRLRSVYVLLICVQFLMITSCRQQTKSKVTITVATASNMQFAMKEIAEAFTSQSGIECELIVGSSGKLTAQITEGAPYDVFVSADIKYPNELYKIGRIIGQPKIYARGKLVLWTMAEGLSPELNSLTSVNIKHIAIANPKNAPYGKAAIEVLQRNGLLDSVKHKLVYGESISQTNQFIISRSAELGFTAMAVVQSTEMKNKGKWMNISTDHYSPIDQGVVVIKRDENHLAQSSAFVDFLFSDKAVKILENFGYSTSE
ncbi:MAG: molybdate ABC transporter substrate-binding protein [Bacteroidia bacterium]|nr:molybdate ABC transporter substrate-binding protein [Bacteroidia bacterium]